MSKEFIQNIQASLPDEVWRPIIYYGEKTTYEVSDKGRVKSLGFSGNGYHIKRERILRQVNVGKYLAVTIYVNRKSVREYVHRLVAMAFIPVPEILLKQGYDMKTLEVNHILGGDENKHLNTVENLEWVTGSGNKYHDYKTGIRDVGEDSHLAVKNKEYQIHNVCKLLEQNKHTVNQISDITGVALGEVYDVLYGGSWTHVSSKYNISNYVPKNRKYDNDTINRIKKYISNGVTMSDISSKLNIPYKSVWYICKNYT